jgi:hypothetical protein
MKRPSKTPASQALFQPFRVELPKFNCRNYFVQSRRGPLLG